MVSLPYVPTPYPDEILGSWLARVPLHNGYGAWRAVLDECGFGRRRHLAIFDLTNYRANLQSLLVALGTNYSRALVELTTYSYWATFDAAANETLWSEGLEKLPALFFNNYQPVKSLKNAGFWRGGGQTRLIRCCPLCLRDDFRKYGEAYWHRSHHLPNIWFCAKHNCPLRHQCPGCGRAPSFSIRETTAAGLRCACGWDLRLRTDGPRPTPAMRRLAEISLQALNAGLPDWSREHVRGFLKSVTTRRDYTEILSSTYELGWDVNKVRSSYRRASAASPFSVALNPVLHLAKAPECCALLAALRLDFHGVTKALRVKPTSSARSRLPKFTLTDETTVEDVRSDLLQRLSRRMRKHSALMWQYWFLRIMDADWVAQQFPYTSRTKLPTISEDRKKIKSFFAKQIELARAGKLASQNDRPACLRARVRDVDWLSQQRALFERGRRIARKMSRDGVHSSRVKTVEEAIAMLLAREERPKVINSRALTNSTGLSMPQIFEVIRHHPPLQRALTEANDDVSRRQLHWAANQLLSEGKHLSLSSMARRASIRPGDLPQLVDEAKRIIAANT